MSITTPKLLLSSSGAIYFDQNSGTTITVDQQPSAISSFTYGDFDADGYDDIAVACGECSNGDADENPFNFTIQGVVGGVG